MLVLSVSGCLAFFPKWSASVDRNSNNTKEERFETVTDTSPLRGAAQRKFVAPEKQRFFLSWGEGSKKEQSIQPTRNAKILLANQKCRFSVLANEWSSQASRFRPGYCVVAHWLNG